MLPNQGTANKPAQINYLAASSANATAVFLDWKKPPDRTIKDEKAGKVTKVKKRLVDAQ